MVHQFLNSAELDLAKTGKPEKTMASPATLQKMESSVVAFHGDKIDAHMFSWLCNMSANPSVRSVVSAAVMDLPHSHLSEIMDLIRKGVSAHMCRR